MEKYYKDIFYKFLIVPACILIMVCNAFAQETNTTTISGIVVDDSTSRPIPGVSVQNMTSKIITVSDVNGEFQIPVKVGEKLVFNFFGFVSETITVERLQKIVVRLVPKETAIEEVVVVGYGEVKKGDLTGSVSVVNVEDIKKAPVARFDEALAGRVAGVQVSSDEGQPGSGMNIVIRGGNSLTQSNSPLYVIDGFPMEDPNTAAINPQDIKSISILKDASATAIYGARGANGVIIIETNTGIVGDTKVSYDTYYGIQEVTKRMELMSPYDFVKYQMEFDPNYAYNAFLTGGKVLDDYKDVKGIDMQNYLFRKAGVHNHNLSINGGNNTTKFSVSGNYLDQNGAVVNSGFKRFAGRVFFDHKVNRRLSFNSVLNYSEDVSSGDLASYNTSGTQPYASFLLYRVWGYRPLNSVGSDFDLESELLDPDGNDQRFNPYLDYSNSINNRGNMNFSFSGNAWYKILSNLTLKVKLGYSRRGLEQSTFYNSMTSRGSSLTPSNTKGVNGSMLNSKYAYWLNENTLTYRPRMKKGQNLTALLGWTIQEDKIEKFGLTGEQLLNEYLGVYGLEEGTPGVNTATETRNLLMSYLGRVDYSIQDKYLFTATMRADGSSKFAAGNRWSYFPSGAFAWKIKNEKFLKEFSPINDAKLRASYGLTGNNRVGNYVTYSSMSFHYNSYYSFNSQPSPGVRIGDFGNKDLKWETTRQLDLGLDLAFLNNRLGLTVDYYNKRTDDLLLRANVPFSSGFQYIYRNVGSVRNEGFEFTLNTLNVRNKNFQWESNFNISFNKNRILALSEDESHLLSPVSWGNYGQTNLFFAEVGGPVGQFYGLIWDGLYQIDDFTWQDNSDPTIPHVDRTYALKTNIPTNGATRATIRPGDIRYVDVNGDGSISSLDNVVIGRGVPLHFGGFNNNLTYKNITLNFLLQWSYGNQIMNANRIYLEGNDANRSALNQFASYADRWSYENQDARIPRAKGQGTNGYYSSRTLEDGSYIRLKTVALNYRLPKILSNTLRIEDINVYGSAQNLLTWTNYSGMDPEVSTRNSALTPGLDFSSYPRMRIYTVGLKVIF